LNGESPRNHPRAYGASRGPLVRLEPASVPRVCQALSAAGVVDSAVLRSLTESLREHGARRVYALDLEGARCEAPLRRDRSTRPGVRDRRRRARGSGG